MLGASFASSPEGIKTMVGRGAGRAALGGQAISRCISHLHCITDYHSLAAGNYAHWPAHSSVGLKSGQGMAGFYAQGLTLMVLACCVSAEALGEGSASKLIQVVGRIKFLKDRGCRHVLLLAVSQRSLSSQRPCAAPSRGPPSSEPAMENLSAITSLSCLTLSCLEEPRLF